MPLPLIPIFAGKAVVAGAIALYGHRFARRLQTPSHYAAQEPAFSPALMLGRSWALDGIAHGPRGRVAARLTGKIHGAWSGQSGHLRLDLTTEKGQWNHAFAIKTEGGPNLSLRGEALKEPAIGVVSGNSLRLRYHLVLPEAYGGWTLDAEDWLFAMPNGGLAYQGQYHKLGWPVGGLSAMLRPL